MDSVLRHNRRNRVPFRSATRFYPWDGAQRARLLAVRVKGKVFVVAGCESSLHRGREDRRRFELGLFQGSQVNGVATSAVRPEPGRWENGSEGRDGDRVRERKGLELNFTKELFQTRAAVA